MKTTYLSWKVLEQWCRGVGGWGVGGGLKLLLTAKQIHNCLVVAAALAKSDQELKSTGERASLRPTQVNEALRRAQEFMQYMTDTQGSSFDASVTSG